MSEQGNPPFNEYTDDPGAPSAGAVPARSARKKVAKKKAASRPRSGDSGRSGAPRQAKTPPPVDDNAATARGWLVILATVLVGLAVFWQGIHKPATQVVTSTPSTTLPGAGTVPNRDAAPPTTAAPVGTTTSRPPTTKVAPAALKILVANGVDPTQTIAGPVATKLRTQGYPTVTTADLAATSPTTFVYYSDDLRAEAQAIATALGYPASSVMAMPATPPTNLSGNQVLVVVGRDRSSAPG